MQMVSTCTWQTKLRAALCCDVSVREGRKLAGSIKIRDVVAGCKGFYIIQPRIFVDGGDRWRLAIPVSAHHHQREKFSQNLRRHQRRARRVGLYVQKKAHFCASHFCAASAQLTLEFNLAPAAFMD